MHRLLQECLIVFLVMVFAVQAVMAEDAPRLFQNPVKSEPREQLSIEDSPSDKKSLRKKRAVRSYRYDGFVSSAVGQIYLVNGLPLSMQQGLKLVAVLKGGSVIELEVLNGEMLRIGIGETVVGKK